MRPHALRVGLLPLALLAASWLAPSPGALAADAPAVHLRILHTNDTHDHLLPFDTKVAKDVGGAGRRAAAIRRLREGQPTLVLDAGDNFQGTPLFTFFKGQADYDALDEEGYDATTVGNHDLDLGLANLRARLRHRHFAVISSNLVDPDGHPTFTPDEVVTVGGLRVGLFGLMGPDAWSAIAHDRQAGVTFQDPEAAARREVARLRPACDLVVMLSHSGVPADEALAAKVPGIDVIVGGHSHTELDQPVEVPWPGDPDHHTLVLQASCYGQYLGQLDLQVARHQVVAYEGHLVPLGPGAPEDPTVVATVGKYEGVIERQMARVVGRAPELLEKDSAGGWADSALGDWTADLIRRRSGAEVGIMNAGGLRGDILAGPVTVGEIYAIYPFDNALVTVQVPGDLLARIVDHSVAISHQGRDEALQFSGATFAIRGGHACDLRVGGQPVDPARTYQVATIDYIALGNDKEELFKQAKAYHPIGLVLRDAVLDEVKAHPVIELAPGDRHRVHWD